MIVVTHSTMNHGIKGWHRRPAYISACTHICCSLSLSVHPLTFNFHSNNIARNVRLPASPPINSSVVLWHCCSLSLPNLINPYINTWFLLFASSETIVTTKAGSLSTATYPTTTPTKTTPEISTRTSATTARTAVTMQSATRTRDALTASYTTTLESTATGKDPTTALESTTRATGDTNAQNSASMESTATATEATTALGMHFILWYRYQWILREAGEKGEYKFIALIQSAYTQICCSLCPSVHPPTFNFYSNNIAQNVLLPASSPINSSVVSLHLA